MLKAASRKDPLLSKVMQAIKQGWSEHQPTNQTWKPYWNFRHDLTVEADCILLGTRVVVPPALQKRVLDELHMGHQGVTRMKARVWSHVWWPSLNKDIEILAKSVCK